MTMLVDVNSLKSNQVLKQVGWWEITGEEGGLSWRNKSDVKLYNGDTVADEMGKVVDELIEVYERVWNRKPYKEELRAALNFVINAMDDLKEHP